jgi:hypothetical protein
MTASTRPARHAGRFLGGTATALDAHRHATWLRARHHRRRIEDDPDLRREVGGLLAQRWSPQQISRHLRRRKPNGGPRGAGVSKASIRRSTSQDRSCRGPQRCPRTGGLRGALVAITPCSAEGRPTASSVPTTHAHHPPSPVRTRRQIPAQALGRRSGHREVAWFGDRHVGGSVRQGCGVCCICRSATARAFMPRSCSDGGPAHALAAHDHLGLAH